MAEETQEVKTPVKKKGGWFQKIPFNVILSPGGIILVFLAIIIEILDLIPIPVIDQIWELPLEIFFIILFIIIVKPSIKSLIIPFVIERIPLVSDVAPTWAAKMFGIF
ncbi:hypothetical protein AMJ47_03430 [Parcubacteria bacterium DG_72]|nr:MAG: hypothetical protein AMJ47_03430 [Parcubacteria bacterium DG_72]